MIGDKILVPSKSHVTSFRRQRGWSFAQLEPSDPQLIVKEG
jgi:hypothetical protein